MASGGRDNSKSVFVGNISWQATEEELTQLFSQAGEVAEFKLFYDRETGRPRGFGFCEFRDENAVQEAIRTLNGQDFNGRALHVDVAKGSGGGGGGGGGGRY